MRTGVALLLAIGLLYGCSGGNTFAPAGNVGPAVKKGGSLSFTFATVDDPASTINEVNGIDVLGEIVGAIGDGSPSNPYQGYLSVPPYTTFTTLSYTGAQGTVATGVTVTTIVGWVVYPPQLPGTWGFVNIDGLWTLTRDRKGGKGVNTATELLGINDANLAVGFYKNSSGDDVPIIENLVTESFSTFKPPNYKSAAATGINDFGDVVGWESAKSGITNGWFLRLGAYFTFSYPKSKATYALGLNSSDQLVGNFIDSDGLSHGFILTNPKGNQKWQRIDEPAAAYGTWVTGINDDDVICGYYVDASHVQHGFVATPKL